MSKKGRNLADLIGGFEDEPQEAAPANEPAPQQTTEPPRIVPLSVLVATEDRRRMRQLSLDTGLSLQKLGHEALNMLLQSRGLEPLSPVTANVPSGRQKRSI